MMLLSWLLLFIPIIFAQNTVPQPPVLDPITITVPPPQPPIVPPPPQPSTIPVITQTSVIAVITQTSVIAVPTQPPVVEVPVPSTSPLPSPRISESPASNEDWKPIVYGIVIIVSIAILFTGIVWVTLKYKRHRKQRNNYSLNEIFNPSYWRPSQTPRYPYF
jgi:hypothetical protein